MDERPLIRHFLACDEIVISPSGERYSLVNVVHAIRPLSGVAYPAGTRSCVSSPS